MAALERPKHQYIRALQGKQIRRGVFQMKRRTRKALLNPALFAVALLFIVYFNQPAARRQNTFEWSTIRYKTTASSLPEARGICPGLKDSSKPALVMSRVTSDGNSTWLHALSSVYHSCVYTVDVPLDTSSRHLQVPANRGHEAMAYLTFIVDNYDDFPLEGAVFVHGSRWAWHNDSPDYDNAALLATLNVSAALAPYGYHNLRCDWSVSTCPASAKPQRSLETNLHAIMEPWDARVTSDAALPGVLANIFGDEASSVGASLKRHGPSLIGRDDVVRSQCCAQFVVARDRVWQHRRDEYVALRQWLLDGSSNDGASTHKRSKNAAPQDDRVAGRILSYMWHILFMQQAELGTKTTGVNLEQLNQAACPSADECYCRLYGRCNLQGCTTPERCHGQYRLPPNLRLPDDWAAMHS